MNQLIEYFYTIGIWTRFMQNLKNGLEKCLFVCNLKLLREKPDFLCHPAFMAYSSGAHGLIWVSLLSLDWSTSLGWR